MKQIFLDIAFLTTSLPSYARDVSSSDRQVILDAARSVASTKAGQPVRLKASKLNVDRNWAVLVGNIVPVDGKGLDWDLTYGECNPHLDKMLWVVLNQKHKRWTVKYIEICAAEPPYWSMEQYGGLVWPCGVYKGLEDGSGETLDVQCRKQINARH
ncbi:hypothetical protein RGU72_20010 [Undibacterium sp. 5I1]|uniref:hypothetical protein n=1 Tax=unclassified Undibacterium TaxID=2630295 RepID=UPI002AB3D4CA|nr:MULTISPECIES: hypothetical protein [unclassified Undibacterium]MDY7540545.1 hypothetical protein [Undibacterium sp. 5I1]MEB0231207.1 hypothetical protein [Undibacterium sp. 10I3]MEB0256510.1 hypothetical protein [Undibacterium sp. 5I1]